MPNERLILPGDASDLARDLKPTQYLLTVTNDTVSTFTAGDEQYGAPLNSSVRELGHASPPVLFPLPVSSLPLQTLQCRSLLLIAANPKCASIALPGCLEAQKAQLWLPEPPPLTLFADPIPTQQETTSQQATTGWRWFSRVAAQLSSLHWDLVLETLRESGSKPPRCVHQLRWYHMGQGDKGPGGQTRAGRLLLILLSSLPDRFLFQPQRTTEQLPVQVPNLLFVTALTCPAGSTDARDAVPYSSDSSVMDLQFNKLARVPALSRQINI
ncbi:hypothetical protein NQZ68_002743 [Dissostichus eleginoides]|nr:hypothetical protein NQZ68_002743 [Dissostichus eleginoides]